MWAKSNLSFEHWEMNIYEHKESPEKFYVQEGSWIIAKHDHFKLKIHLAKHIPWAPINLGSLNSIKIPRSPFEHTLDCIGRAWTTAEVTEYIWDIWRAQILNGFPPRISTEDHHFEIHMVYKLRIKTLVLPHYIQGDVDTEKQFSLYMQHTSLF